MARSLPTCFMRGGTSRGPFFRASDLPLEIEERDRVLLRVMGSPDARQIDGLGGADPLTSKVGIVSVATEPGADIDFLFAQVLIEEARVDTTPNCGNMLAAALPFALEAGLLVAPRGALQLTKRVRTLNTGTLADISIALDSQGKPRYDGDARIDSVPGNASPVSISFLDTEGSVCGSLLPTGHIVDVFDGIEVTCIDNGMPVVVMRAQDLGVSGYETRDALNANAALKAQIESIRLQAGKAMGLGDVTKKVVPKMSLLAPPAQGGAVCSRTFIPHDCHAAVGVLGAVSIATACVLSGSPGAAVATIASGEVKRISVEHPTGEFTVELTLEGAKVVRAALLRTARLIMKGEVYL